VDRGPCPQARWGQAVINPQHFLEQAQLLLDLDKRSQANLRRATSTAYYALFHLLIQEACAFHVGRGRDKRFMRAALARAFGHEEMKRASKSFASGTLPEQIEAALNGAGALYSAKGRTSLSREVKSVAKAFVDLQTARHKADYDHFARLGAKEVGDYIQAVRDAFAAWDKIRGQRDADVYMMALLSGDRLAKR
jgi:hypothetical protein